jgi:hypothetical protein
LPAAIADIAYQNKAVIYDLLFKASAGTMLTIGADPEHLVRSVASHRNAKLRRRKPVVKNSAE